MKTSFDCLDQEESERSIGWVDPRLAGPLETVRAIDHLLLERLH